MGYQVLARKWRPQTFEQVVGQTHVLKALANGLKHGRVHHAYLFSGTRGVGKTSIARLLAKGLNCETGVTDKPCGTCQHCLEIEKGRFVDLLEIDAASRTKVEDTRELLDNIQYAPVKGRFKVYLIDEVHMLSKHSFNALLKTLEEPPEHVKFLLATTDPQKLPITILSRCLQFNLRAMDITQITTQLSHILTEENIPFDTKALQLLARAAEGSMRDALSLTDQAIASGENQVLTDVVINMLGMLDDDQPIAIADALIRGNTLDLFEQIKLINEKGSSWSETLTEVTAIFHQIALIQLLPSAIEPHYAHHELKLKDLARIVSPTDLQIFYQIMILGQKELPYAPFPKMGVEMTLLRALALHPHKIAKSDTKVDAVEPKSLLQNNPNVAQPSTSTVTTASLSNDTHSRQNNGIEAINSAPTNHVHLSAPNAFDAQKSPLSTTANQKIQSQSQNQIENSSPIQSETSHQETLVKSKLSPTEHLLKARAQLKQANHRNQDEKKSQKTEVPPQSITHPDSSIGLQEEVPVLDKAPQTAIYLETHSQENLSLDAQIKAPLARLESIKNDDNSTLSLDEKIAQHQKLISEIENNEESILLDEYQWSPQQVEDEQSSINNIKEIKNSFETDKTPEIQKKLIETAQQRDPWAHLIGQLNLPKLVEQLCLNSVFEQKDDNIKIEYRSSHQHLAHNGAKQKILDALNEFLKIPVAICFDVSDDRTRLTPFEIRQEIYSELLQDAKALIYNDKQLKMLCEFFDATIEDESIRPIS